MARFGWSTPNILDGRLAMSRPSEWATPYSMVPSAGAARTYDVHLDGGPLVQNIDCSIAYQITGLLNGAYNLGRMHAQVDVEQQVQNNLCRCSGAEGVAAPIN